MITQQTQFAGVEDIQRRVAQIGLKAKDLRRPSMSIAQSAVLANRQRLDRGVDVHGSPLRSKRAAQLGLTPLGGGSGDFGRSLVPTADNDGPVMYSTFKGAGVAYRGDTIVPRLKKFLWVPARAKGGVFASKARAVSVIANRFGDRSSHYRRRSSAGGAGSFVLRRSNGRVLLVVQKISGGALRVLAFLVKKVRYPKNEWAGFSDGDQNNATKVYANYLDTFGETK
jgi:hypothetical protein